MTSKRISLKVLVVVLGMILASIALPQPTLAQSVQTADAIDIGQAVEASRFDAWLRSPQLSAQPSGF